MRKRSVPAKGADPNASPDPGPVSKTTLSSLRARAIDKIPSAWLDRLLSTVVEIASGEDEAAMSQAVLGCLVDTLPEYAFAARLFADRGPGAGMARLFVASPGRGRAVREVPDARVAPVFAELRYEHRVAIANVTEGSELLVASDLDELDARDSGVVRLVERAASVLGALVAKSREGSASNDRASSAVSKRMIQVDKLATFGQLAAGVVHELNNPLTSIVASAEVLIRKFENGSGDALDIERLRRIDESAKRMLYFTRELVGYARPTSGVLRPFALSEVVDQAAAFCEHVMASANVTLERRYDPGVPPIQGVSEQLVQVFVNLFTNACQARRSPTGGCVSVSIAPIGDGNAVEVCVADDGVGIAPENLDRVFVPFFTTKRDSQGIGLGLAISKSIIDGHGGSIVVESREGVGTRFLIELPTR